MLKCWIKNKEWPYQSVQIKALYDMTTYSIYSMTYMKKYVKKVCKPKVNISPY